MTEIWSKTHKNPLQTHIEALKIQNLLEGDPLTPPPPPPDKRGSPPLVLSPLSCRRHSMISSAGPLLNTRRRPWIDYSFVGYLSKLGAFDLHVSSQKAKGLVCIISYSGNMAVPVCPLCLVPHLRSLDDRFSYPVV